MFVLVDDVIHRVYLLAQKVGQSHLPVAKGA